MELKLMGRWLLGAVANAATALYFASMTGFPTWIVWGVLIILEGVPLLWLADIPYAILIDESAIGGFWIVLQSLMFGAYIFCLPGVLVKYASGWGMVVLVFIFISTGVYAMVFRIKTMRSLLSETDK